jgi:hypothetical protein
MQLLFSFMDLDYPGLDRVARALRYSDPIAAAREYLDFARERTPPASWWHPLYGHESFAQRSSWFDFFTDIPKTISWRDRERLSSTIDRGHGYSSTEQPLAYGVIELADLILAGTMFHPWWPNIPPQSVGSPWNWDHVPPDGDQSWTCHLQRLEHLLALAQAYWITDDERYIRCAIELAVDFISGWETVEGDRRSLRLPLRSSESMIHSSIGSSPMEHAESGLRRLRTGFPGPATVSCVHTGVVMRTTVSLTRVRSVSSMPTRTSSRSK